MYLSHNSILFILSCLTIAMYVDGFLLNPGQTSSPGITSQYISMDMYLAEKKELRNQIFQFQRENEQTLQLLTTQLQQKLTVMDDKLKQSNKPNDTIELAYLEHKNQDLEMNLTILQEKHRLLQISYVRQKDQLDLLKNTSAQVIKELSELKQLKSVNQTLDLSVVKSRIQSLEQKTDLLTNNQNARSQDFLALYNVTRVTDSNVNQIGKQFAIQLRSEIGQNATIANMANNIKDLIDRFHNFAKLSNNSQTVALSSCVERSETFASVVKFSKIYLKIGISDTQSFQSSGKFTCTEPGLYYISAYIRVSIAVTACVSSSTKSVDGVVKFSSVRSNVGINKIATFQSSGKFECEIPGLYFISAYIFTKTPNHTFYIKKNDLTIVESASDTQDGYSTNPISAAVQLQQKDTLYVYTTIHVIDSGNSCLTIMKVR
ncbi:uncharacterized protein [Mytilus edulis]|uniref:uncharacterized protein n=1 Tax=Mytilus edulis TaxID=6550 RepID=UPI0039EF32AB